MRQDEDTDGEGAADRRFAADRAVAVPAGAATEGEHFGGLGCGSFHRFSRKW